MIQFFHYHKPTNSPVLSICSFLQWCLVLQGIFKVTYFHPLINFIYLTSSHIDKWQEKHFWRSSQVVTKKCEMAYPIFVLFRIYFSSVKMIATIDHFNGCWIRDFDNMLDWKQRYFQLLKIYIYLKLSFTEKCTKMLVHLLLYSL